MNEQFKNPLEIFSEGYPYISFILATYSKLYLNCIKNSEEEAIQKVREKYRDFFPKRFVFISGYYP